MVLWEYWEGAAALHTSVSGVILMNAEGSEICMSLSCSGVWLVGGEYQHYCWNVEGRSASCIRLLVRVVVTADE